VKEARRLGLGVARRVSATTGKDLLYVAKLVGSDAAGDVLRLSSSVEGIQRISSGTEAVLRNAQAVAVSVALGLSLLAALVLVRPLARVRTVAEQLAAGDFGLRASQHANDEIGDVGRALEKLVPELRRRMAVAGAGEAMLVQLVEVLDKPVAIFEVDGDVLALNGAARRLLQIEGPSAGQSLREMLDDEALREALALAEEEGQPESVRLRARDRIVEGASVFVLKRPGSAPLGLLLAPTLDDEQVSDLPQPSDVEPLALSTLLESAQETANGSLAGSGVELSAPSELPEVSLADAQGRLASALTRTLVSCAGTFGGRPGRIHLDITVQDTRVGLSLDAGTGTDDLGVIRPLIEPLGGSVDTEPGETTLWLPRA
jgi:HAMP domain-containing protein